jgi:hypothetical protein
MPQVRWQYFNFSGTGQPGANHPLLHPPHWLAVTGLV